MATSDSGPETLNDDARDEGAPAGMDAAGDAWEPLQSVHPSGKPSHILIVMTGAVRDAVLAASMLPYIKTNYGEVRVTIACRRHVAEIFEACPHIDDVFPFARIRAYEDQAYCDSLLTRLREMGIDAAFNASWSREPIADLLAVGSRARDRIGFDGDCLNMSEDVKTNHNRFYTGLMPGQDGTRPELERYRDFLNGLGISARPLAPRIWLTPEDEEFAVRFFPDNHLEPEKTIALFIGSQSEVEGYVRYGEALSGICRENGFTVVAPGRAPERQACQQMIDAIHAPSVNLCGETTIRRAAAIIKRCRLAVGAECGLAHVARAVDAPDVILPGGGQFGRFSPCSTGATAACLPLDCFGCDWKCRYETPHCIRGVLPEVVADAVKAALASPPKRIRVFVQGESLWNPLPGQPEWRLRDQALPPGRVEIRSVGSLPDVDVANIRNQRGERLFKEGDPDGAMDQFTRAVRLLPDGAHIHNNLGVLHHHQGNPDLALASFRRSVELQPKNGAFLKNLADFFHVVLGRLEEASTWYVKALEIDPLNAEVLLSMGRVNTALDKPDEAAGFFRQVLAADPGNEEARRMLDPPGREGEADEDRSLAAALSLIGRGGATPSPLAEMLSEMDEATSSAPGEMTRDPEESASPRPENRKRGVRASIIMMADNRRETIDQCVAAIRERTPEPHEIVLVGAGADKEVVEWLKETRGYGSNLRFVESRENAGPAARWNLGVQASTGEYILFMHNDVTVSPRWLSGMLRTMEARPEYVMVGPMTDARHGIQSHPEAARLPDDGFDEYANAFRRRSRGRRVETRRLADFCLLFRRDLVETVGGGDERFENDAMMVKDLCARVGLEGPRCVVAADVLVRHHDHHPARGGESDRRASVARDRRAYEEKWRALADDARMGPKIRVRNAVNTGVEIYRADRIPEAEEMMTDGVRNLPGENRARLALIGLHLDAGRFQEALEVLNAAPPGISASDPRFQESRAASLVGLERFSEAGDLVNDALARDERSTIALNLKGRIAQRLGDVDEAERLFYQAIAADPGYGKPYSNLGELKWAAGAREEALDLHAKGFTRSPFSAESSSLYHTAVTALAAFQEAEAVFQEAGALYPACGHVAFLRITVYLQQGKVVEAMTAIEDALVRFGMDEGMLSAALDVRKAAGPMTINKAGDHRGTISLCMVVKNERRRLANCLASVKPAVDEMIVVDMGSTDGTREAAMALGARVHDFSGPDDISSALTHAVSKASGAWIFLMEPDEVLSPRDVSVPRDLATKPPSAPLAHSFVTRNYAAEAYDAPGWTPNDRWCDTEEAGAGWFPTTRVRLFPNREDIRIENPAHEFLTSFLERVGVSVEECATPIHNYGKLEN